MRHCVLSALTALLAGLALLLGPAGPARAEEQPAALAPLTLTLTLELELPVGTGVHAQGTGASGPVDVSVGPDPAYVVRLAADGAAPALEGEALVGEALVGALRERLGLARRPAVRAEALGAGLALLTAPAGAHFALREDLRASGPALRVVLAVGPWSSGRRRVDASECQELRATAAGGDLAAAPRAQARTEPAATPLAPAEALAQLYAWHALASPLRDPGGAGSAWLASLVRGLSARAAGESDEQHLARALAPLLAAPKEASDDAAKAEALSLLGVLAPALPAVAALLADAATGGPSPMGAAARAALDLPAARGPVVFDALAEQAARDPARRADRAIMLLRPRAADEAERVLALLAARVPERRTLALALLPRLATLPPERMAVLDLPAMLKDPAPGARALGLFAKLTLVPKVPLAAPEALYLAALLRDEGLFGALELMLRDQAPKDAQGVPQPVAPAEAPPAVRALWAFVIPSAGVSEPAALVPLSAAPLERCLQALALARQSVPKQLPPEAWVELLSSPDSEVRALGAAAAAVLGALPAPVVARLRALYGDAAEPRPVRWLAGAAVVLQGGAPKPVVADVEAGLKELAASPWAPLVRTLLRQAER